MPRVDEEGKRLVGARVMSNFRFATGRRFSTPRTRSPELAGQSPLLFDDRGELILWEVSFSRTRLSTDGFVKPPSTEVAGPGRPP